jgi:general secretion pathway protein L
VDRALTALTGRGLNLGGVDVRDHDRTLGLNLLPAERRVRTTNPRTRLNLALGAACVVLLALVMAQSLYLRAHQVSELEAAIAGVQDEAREVAQIRKQIEDASEAAGFLASRRTATPLAIEVLADVTRILPDDTFLDRLVIGADTVQMQGKSRNAQQLIEKVNESPLLDAAAFRGSTRLDARSGLEIFEVNASVTPMARTGGEEG